jgi:hypothetical protein
MSKACPEQSRMGQSVKLKWVMEMGLNLTVVRMDSTLRLSSLRQAQCGQDKQAHHKISHLRFKPHNNRNL